MKNYILPFLGSMIIALGMISCEKGPIASKAPENINGATPMQTQKCCGHFHSFTVWDELYDDGPWVAHTEYRFCCNCGVLHNAGNVIYLNGDTLSPEAVIAGATVEYLDDNERVVGTFVTDSSGHWNAKHDGEWNTFDIPDGEYLVRFTKDCYLTSYAHDVEIRDGENVTDIIVEMEADPHCE